MRVLFLPGAGGSAGFWRPVADRLPATWEKVRLNWPGAGDEPHDPGIGSFDDLVGRAGAVLGHPADVVGHSLGGVVAVRLALRHPGRVRRLVLTATSAGLGTAHATAVDWRDEYRAEYPRAAAWITAPTTDETAAISRITVPVLLLWADADPISPVTVGRRLERLLPHATLRVVRADGHGFAHDRPELVAPAIAAHLAAPEEEALAPHAT